MIQLQGPDPLPLSNEYYKGLPLPYEYYKGSYRYLPPTTATSSNSERASRNYFGSDFPSSCAPRLLTCCLFEMFLSLEAVPVIYGGWHPLLPSLPPCKLAYAVLCPGLISRPNLPTLTPAWVFCAIHVTCCQNNLPKSPPFLAPCLTAVPVCSTPIQTDCRLSSLDNLSITTEAMSNFFSKILATSLRDFSSSATILNSWLPF